MTTLTLMVDISQVAEAHLPDEISMPGIRDIILIARNNQYPQDISFTPEVSWIFAEPTMTQKQRFSLAAHHVSTEWLIYAAGSWPSTVEIQENLTERTALLTGQIQTKVETSQELEDLETGAQRGLAFVMQVRAYSVLQGFSGSIGRFADALADFALRCRLLGWSVETDKPGVVISAPQGVPFDESRIETIEVRREIPETVRLIANLPHWPHKPHGSDPLVSVVISTRNRAEFIAEAINSVRLQTFQDFEIIVVDDGGSDNTKEIIDSIGDPRIRYFWQEHGGIAAARNLGADKSRGFLTAVHDSDDIMLPNRLELGVRALHNEFSASYGAWVNFNETTGELIMHVTKEDFDLDVLAVTGQATGHPTWLIPTGLIRKLRYDTRLTSAVDHNLATRSALLGVRWKHVHKAVVLRRIHDGQVSAFDVKSQKVGAQLTRQFAVTGLRADVERSAKERVKEHHPWAHVDERADIPGNFTKYLPGQGWPSAVMVTGPLASKLGILTNYDGNVIITAETYPDGRVRRERAWLLNPGTNALAELSSNGYPFEAVTASTNQELLALAEKWISDRLTQFQKKMDEQPLLVATSEAPIDLSDARGLCFYARDLDGGEKWTVAIPVADADQVKSAVETYKISAPMVMVSKPVELAELMAMIGADVS